MIGQIQEIITWYIPEGLFLDIFDCPICYCQYCEARYKKRYGMEMPKGKDKERYWRELQEFQDRDLRYDLLKDIVDVVRHCERRHVGISINGTHMIFRKELLDLVDYDYAEPWTSYYLSAAFARGVSKGKFPQIGPGGVSNVYDPQNASVFVLAAAQIASQGCRVFMFCGSQHPDGTLDKLEFENLGSAYGEVKKFQNYLLDRDSVKSLAILYSEKTRLFESPSGPDREMGSWYRNNLAGTLELASYCLYPFDVLPEWEIGSVRAYEAVISPNVSCMSDQTVNSLRDYVEEGGILIASSKTSLKDEQGREPENFRLAELFGCDFLRVNDDFIVNPWGSYLHKKPHEIWQNLPDTDLAVTPPFIETKFKNGEVLATHIMPCITMSPEKWVNWWSPPPSYKNGKSQATAFPAVQLNSYGKGKVVYFSFDLFSMSGGFLWPRKFMLQMLEFLLPNPRIRTKASTHEGLGVTYFRRRGEGQIIIHQVNHTVSALRGEIRPIDGGTILVDEEYAMPKNCQLVYPRATKLKVEMTEKGHSIMKVPPVDIHSIIAIKTE